MPIVHGTPQWHVIFIPAEAKALNREGASALECCDAIIALPHHTCRRRHHENRESVNTLYG